MTKWAIKYDELTAREYDLLSEHYSGATASKPVIGTYKVRTGRNLVTHRCTLRSVIVKWWKDLLKAAE